VLASELKKETQMQSEKKLHPFVVVDNKTIIQVLDGEVNRLRNENEKLNSEVRKLEIELHRHKMIVDELLATRAQKKSWWQRLLPQ
jgi:putative heme degradation protein